MNGADAVSPDPSPTAAKPAASVSSKSEWLTQRERGTLMGMKLAYLAARLAGRRFTRPLVSLVALYYRLLDRRAVRSSRDWLRRVLGREPSFLEVYQHMRSFAQVTFDRMFLVQGQVKGMQFTYTGREVLEAAAQSGRGAVLLGAHVGSYEAMRAGGAMGGFKITVLGFFGQSRMLNALLRELNPGHTTQVIDISGDPIDTMASIQRAIQDGHMVVSMVDRTGIGQQVSEARFFGEMAAFAGGPFVLASVLKCPVYMVFGLYREPNTYDLHCELFAERIDLPRKTRASALQQCVQSYAQRLEHYCRKAPFNWFNFHDFWKRN